MFPFSISGKSETFLDLDNLTGVPKPGTASSSGLGVKVEVDILGLFFFESRVADLTLCFGEFLPLGQELRGRFCSLRLELALGVLVAFRSRSIYKSKKIAVPPYLYKICLKISLRNPRALKITPR